MQTPSAVFEVGFDTNVSRIVRTSACAYEVIVQSIVEAWLLSMCSLGVCMDIFSRQ
jgi:hypothetical protein